MGDERQHAFTGSENPVNQRAQPWQGIPTHVPVQQPGLHPHVLAGGSTARHRRWAWIGMAGLGVALVALVAATLVWAPWTPPAAPVATAPSPATEGPAGAAERLRGPVNMVRSGMAGWAEDPAVPDPSAELPCPDASAALDLSHTAEDPEPTGINAAGSTLSGCAWTDDRAGRYHSAVRIDVSLRAEPGFSTDTVMGRLKVVVKRDGCDWASVFPNGPFAALMVCETDDQRVWTLVVADDDGSGAWLITTAVGADLSRAFNMAAELTTGLWGVVSGLTAEDVAPAPGAGPRVPRMDREFVELVHALAARPQPVSMGGSGDRACRDASGEVSSALDAGVFRASAPGATPSEPFCWWTLGPPPTDNAEFAETLSFAVAVDDRSDYASHRAAVHPGAQQVSGPGGPVVPDRCLSSDLPLTRIRTSILACSLAGFTRWSVVTASPDGAGLWVLEVHVPAGSRVDPSRAVLALVEVADRNW